MQQLSCGSSRTLRVARLSACLPFLECTHLLATVTSLSLMRYILTFFSKAQDIKVVKLILGAYFMGQQRRFGDSSHHDLQLVGYTAIEVQSVFAELVAIIQVSDGPQIHLVFYHASMTDYLKDKSRSEIYHVDMDDVAAELSSICLRNFYDQGTLGDHLISVPLSFSASLVSTMFALCHVKEATPELSKALVDASKRRFDTNLVDMYHLHLIMVIIEKLVSEIP